MMNVGECSDQRFFERRKTFEREKAETIKKGGTVVDVQTKEARSLRV